MKLGREDKKNSILYKDDRKASQGYVDIKNKTIEQLDELIKRQDKLLQNRSFLDKLPDKGKKILSFKAELEAEYKKKQEEFDSACQLLFKLSLNDKTPEDIEWNQGKLTVCRQQLDSDDDDDDDSKEIDPLKLVANHSGTASGKNIKIKCTENKLYVDKFCEKYGQLTVKKERFKPNQLKNNDKSLFVTSAVKVKERLGTKWEVTQATPPVPVYKDTVMISLPESLKLQNEQAQKLKELDKKQATEKLIQNMSVKMGDKLPISNITEYRNSNFFNESGDDNEVTDSNDSDVEDKDRTVYFPADDKEDL